MAKKPASSKKSAKDPTSSKIASHVPNWPDKALPEPTLSQPLVPGFNSNAAFNSRAKFRGYQSSPDPSYATPAGEKGGGKY